MDRRQLALALLLSALAIVFMALRWQAREHERYAQAMRYTRAQVARVIDGDTLDVKISGKVVRVRIADIDAPELDQPWGEQSAAWLAQWTPPGAWVHLSPGRRERWGRRLSAVFVGGVDLRREAVREGQAWVYKTCRDELLLATQEAARRERRGLWREREPMAPWDWRRVRGLEPEPWEELVAGGGIGTLPRGYPPGGGQIAHFVHPPTSAPFLLLRV